jgi:hypothetical protein
MSELLRTGNRAATQSAPSAEHHSGRVFTLFLRRWLAVLDLTSRDVDDQLGELGGIARTFGVFVGHGTRRVAFACNGPDRGFSPCTLRMR